MNWVLLILSAMPTSGMRELLIPTSPLSAVYADALVASRHKAAYLVNPSLAVNATSPVLPSTYVNLTHTEWFAGSRWERVDFFYPTRKWGIMGASLGGFHLWNFEYRSHPDSAAVTYPTYTTDIQIHYANMIGNLRLGASLGGLYERIYTYSTIAAYLSMGAAYNLKPFLFGVSVSNLGFTSSPLGDVPWSGSEPLPTRFQLGAGWNPSEKLDIQTGLSYGFDGTLEASVGAGCRIFEILEVHAGGGYGIKPFGGAGIDINLKRLRLGYAASWHNNIGFSHHVGVEITIPQRPAEDPYLASSIETSRKFTELGDADMTAGRYKEAMLKYDVALAWYADNQEAREGYLQASARVKEREIINHLDAARNYREDGNYLDALREYEFVLAMDTANRHALSGRADMLLELENMPMLTQEDVPSKAVELFEEGVQAFRADDFHLALQWWREIRDRYPYIEEIDPFIDLATRRSENRIDSLLVAAWDARKRDALREAIELAERVLEIDATNARAHTFREEIISLAQRRISELLDAAEEDFEDNNFADAAEKFSKVLAIDPENTKATEYLERIKKEERLNRENLIQLNLSATTAYASGDYDTAINLWEQILEVDSTFTNVERNLERALKKKMLLEARTE